MTKHPDTLKRESYIISRATTVLRQKYNDEYLGYMAEARRQPDCTNNKATSFARKSIKAAHAEEYSTLRGEIRDTWNALNPELAKSIDERTTNNEVVFAARNKPGRGMKKQLGIPSMCMTPEEADQVIRHNYAWIQKKRRGN